MQAAAVLVFARARANAGTTTLVDATSDVAAAVDPLIAALAILDNEQHRLVDRAYSAAAITAFLASQADASAPLLAWVASRRYSLEAARDDVVSDTLTSSSAAGTRANECSNARTSKVCHARNDWMWVLMHAELGMLFCRGRDLHALTPHGGTAKVYLIRSDITNSTIQPWIHLLEAAFDVLEGLPFAVNILATKLAQQSGSSDLGLGT